MREERLPVPPIPDGMSLREFGEFIMRWGTGDDEARSRIPELNRTALLEAGVTREMALQWRDFYRREMRINLDNPSAAGRTDLMQAAADLL